MGSSVFENLSVFGGFVDVTGTIEDRSRQSDDEWNGFGTVALAYDHQIGKFVVGAFADFDFHPDSESQSSNDINGSGTVSFIGFPIFDFPLEANVDSNLELDNVWSVGGRVGYLIQPKVLLYALGGYTEANIDGSATLSYDQLFNLVGPNQVSVDMPDELHGYFVGGGGEVMVHKNLSLKLEYRYAHYGSEKRSSDVDLNFDGGGFIDYTQRLKIDTEVDADIHTVRGALVFRLGHEDRRPIEPLR